MFRQKELSMKRNLRFAVAFLILFVAASPAPAGLILLNNHVEVFAQATADGTDSSGAIFPLVGEEQFIQTGSGRDGTVSIPASLAGSAQNYSAYANALSGDAVANGQTHGFISSIVLGNSALLIHGGGSAVASGEDFFGTYTPGIGYNGYAIGRSDSITQLQFQVDQPYNYQFTGLTSGKHDQPLNDARVGFGYQLSTGGGPLPSQGVLAPGYIYNVNGKAIGVDGIISTYDFFLSLSSVGPVGSVQEAPIVPAGFVPDSGGFVFNNIASGSWFDPPITEGYHYETTDGSLFTSILDFPTGFTSPFQVSVGGQLLGQFLPGQSVDFGTGVSAFDLTGIQPGVDVQDAAGFPLRLAFNTSTADFRMTPTTLATTAVPEPDSFALLGFGMLILLGYRKRRSFNRGKSARGSPARPALQSFNGAAVFQPRKGRGKRPRLDGCRCFNGAAVFQPRKAHRSR